jgi:glucose-1-phosphate adenylyltransferase
MPNVKIGNNVTIEKAIIGSGTVIEDGAVIRDSEQGLTLIGENQRISSESALLQSL